MFNAIVNVTTKEFFACLFNYNSLLYSYCKNKSHSLHIQTKTSANELLSASRIIHKTSIHPSNNYSNGTSELASRHTLIMCSIISFTAYIWTLMYTLNIEFVCTFTYICTNADELTIAGWGCSATQLYLEAKHRCVVRSTFLYICATCTYAPFYVESLSVSAILTIIFNDSLTKSPCSLIDD